MDNPAAPIPSTPAQSAVSSLPVEALAKAGPAESPNRRRVLWLAGGLFILIIGIAIGVFGAKFLNQSPNLSQLPPAPTPIQSPSPTPTPDLNREPDGSAATANWKSYNNPTLEIEFKLPPLITKRRELQWLTKPSGKGDVICGEYPLITSLLIKPIYAGAFSTCNINPFGISAESSDYEAGRSSIFADTSGYAYENGQYFYITNYSKKQILIDPGMTRLMTNPYGVDILIITSHNPPDDWPLPQSPPDGYIGAIVNLDNPTYPAITLQMKLDSQLTEKLFNQILSTFKFLD